uniref:Uncharacterized protein n=1 Tax=Oryza meridionalis TaxID=40149 RepID=A0A0E0BWE1_9ORYZ
MAERERNQAEQAEWSGCNVGEDEDRAAAPGSDVWGEDSVPVAGGSPSLLVLSRSTAGKEGLLARRPRQRLARRRVGAAGHGGEEGP